MKVVIQSALVQCPRLSNNFDSLIESPALKAGDFLLHKIFICDKLGKKFGREIKMQEKKSIQNKAKCLVREFKKKEERGEFRNKLGRIWWPVWNRFIVPAACLCGILSGSFAGFAFGATLFAVAYPVTKGFSVNIQNIAIKNAGIFGRFLKQRKIPYETRRMAVEEYLHQSGSLFFNNEWVRKHPQDIDKMAEGQKGTIIPNLVALLEYNLTRAGNATERKNEGSPKKVKLPLRQRLTIYQRTYADYKRGLKR